MTRYRTIVDPPCQQCGRTLRSGMRVWMCARDRDHKGVCVALLPRKTVVWRSNA